MQAWTSQSSQINEQAKRVSVQTWTPAVPSPAMHLVPLLLQAQPYLVLQKDPSIPVAENEFILQRVLEES